MSRKRRSKRYSKHSKTHIRRNMYRKKHKKTQRGGARPNNYGNPGEPNIRNHFEQSASDKPKPPHMPIPVYNPRPIPNKVDVPAGFLPRGWKIIYREEDNKPFILTPGCSSVYTPGSQKLRDILEYYYRTSTHSEVPPKLPTPPESPKLPTIHESPKSPTSHKSPTPRKRKSSNSSKSS
jgi:hypothetical protein